VPGPSNKATASSPLLGFTDPLDVIDSIIDALDQPARPSETRQDAEAKLLENLLRGLQRSAGSNRAIRIISIVVIGGKILKLVVGGERNDQDIFLPLDALIDREYTMDPDRGRRLVDRIQSQLSGAGVVVMDPVWLKDPRA